MASNAERITDLEKRVSALETADKTETAAAKANNEFWSAIALKLNGKTDSDIVAMFGALKTALASL